MCALLDDIAVLHHEDEVRVFDRREAVGYDEARAVLRQCIHGPLRQELRAGIDGGRRLIENEHRAVLHHGAGNGEQLLLPGGNGDVFAENRVKPVRERLDEVIDAAGAAGVSSETAVLL